MSGGAYHYKSYQIQEFADEMRTHNDPRRIAFKKLLQLCANVAHDIEFIDSGDYGENDADKSLNDVFTFLGNDATIITKAHSFDEMKIRLQEFFK